MLQALYNSFESSGYVYLVVETGEIPLLIPHTNVVQNDYVPEEDGTAEEGLINAFTTLEGAENEKQEVIEFFDRRPSDLKVVKLSISDLFSLIDELKTMFTGSTGHLFRIDLVLAFPDQDGWKHVADTIYSAQVPIN